MKTLKISMLLMGLFFLQSTETDVQAAQESVGEITCYCNTSCTECASNGGDPTVCAKVSDTDGDCSTGKSKCTSPME